jgi:hypothetical protein
MWVLQEFHPDSGNEYDTTDFCALLNEIYEVGALAGQADRTNVGMVSAGSCSRALQQLCGRMHAAASRRTCQAGGGVATCHVGEAGCACVRPAPHAPCPSFTAPAPATPLHRRCQTPQRAPCMTPLRGSAPPASTPSLTPATPQTRCGNSWGLGRRGGGGGRGRGGGAWDAQAGQAAMLITHMMMHGCHTRLTHCC